jgi:hypothetical protein
MYSMCRVSLSIDQIHVCVYVCVFLNVYVYISFVCACTKVMCAVVKVYVCVFMHLYIKKSVEEGTKYP